MTARLTFAALCLLVPTLTACEGDTKWSPPEGRYVVQCSGAHADTVIGSSVGGDYIGAELGVYSDSIRAFTFTTKQKGCTARRLP